MPPGYLPQPVAVSPSFFSFKSTECSLFSFFMLRYGDKTPLHFIDIEINRKCEYFWLLSRFGGFYVAF
jgi:hypothetical protein